MQTGPMVLTAFLSSPFVALPHSAAAQSLTDVVRINGVTAVRDGAYASDIGTQVRHTLENLGAALGRYGLAYSDVVRANVYLADARDFGTMNEVYRSFFAERPPSRATVESDLSDPEALVQISIVAAERGADRELIVPTDLAQPALPYSWGHRVGSTVFLAGVTSRNPESYLPVAGDIRAQTRQVMENIGAVLRAANLGYDHLVRCNVFLRDPRDFRAMTEVYRSYFSSVPPTRATVRAGLMNPLFRVEAQCVAESGQREAVMAEGGTPSPNLSSGIRTDDQLYLSGMLGRGPDGFGDVEDQTRRTLANLRATLAAAEWTLSEVVDATIYVTDIRYLWSVRAVFDEIMPAGVLPTTTIAAQLMNPAALVEISMIANRDE